MTTHRITGRKSKRAGDSAEAELLEAARVLRARGVRLTLRKLPTPTVHARPAPGGAFVARYAAKAGCDMRGTLDGRSLVIEVKSASGTSLPLWRHAKPVLSVSQLGELQEEHRCGAIAGVMVRLGLPPSGPLWWWLAVGDWTAAVDSATHHGAKSLSLARLDAFGSRCASISGLASWPLLPDFVEAMTRGARIENGIVNV